MHPRARSCASSARSRLAGAAGEAPPHAARRRRAGAIHLSRYRPARRGRCGSATRAATSSSQCSKALAVAGARPVVAERRRRGRSAPARACASAASCAAATSPSGGKLVELQAFERGHWRSVRTVRTNAKGAFSYRYRFSFRASGTTFPVRVRVRADGSIRARSARPSASAFACAEPDVRRPRDRRRAHPDTRSGAAVRDRRRHATAGRSSRSATTPRCASVRRAHGGARRRGQALIPGLVDSHVHPFWGAELARGTDLALPDARGVLAALAASTPQRGWLFAWGLDYDAAPTAAGDRRGGQRRRRVRAALGPAHGARHAARAGARAGHRPARLRRRPRRSCASTASRPASCASRRAGPRAARRARPALAGDPRPPRGGAPGG